MSRLTVKLPSSLHQGRSVVMERKRTRLAEMLTMTGLEN